MSIQPSDGHALAARAIVAGRADSTRHLEEIERMARRRHQDPTPVRRGKWWIIRIRYDELRDGKPLRVERRVQLAPASIPVREAQRIADDKLRPLNQGVQNPASAITFKAFAEKEYIPTEMPALATTTQHRYQGVIRKYLISDPDLGKLCLFQISKLCVQKFINKLATNPATNSLSQDSKDKIRDVLSSVLGAAVKYGILATNPAEGVRLPREKRGKRKAKPHISPEQFELLLGKVAEPYATMVYVATYTGLRISELVGLRWEDVHADSITVDERYCRGDWSAPKSEASNATIGVDGAVIDRLHRLKSLTVAVRAGRATRRYKVVKSAEPSDLVFQSVRTGKPMRDNNILVRFIKPAAKELGIPWVNWRCLRTSHATWMIEAGANPKDVQGQMRHSKISTTMDIYAQFVPESQRKAVSRMTTMVAERRARVAAAQSLSIQ